MKIIDREEIMEGVRLSFSELKRREEKADIKISDYIIENYKKRQLFYSKNHPTNDVLIEYTERILQCLGYDTEEKMSGTDFFVKAGTLKGHDLPLYPAVIKALGISDYEDRCYPNRYFNSDVSLSIEEWIRAYICLLNGLNQGELY